MSAHRGFTVLLAALLVSSLVAPMVATQPAAAQTSTTDEICSSPARFFQIVNVPCTTSEELGTVDESESGAYLQSDLHANAEGVDESWDATYVLLGNYMQDTPTIASLEGKEAIASSWENGSSRTVAADNVNESIADYYARQEWQVLEEYSAHQAQLAYLAQQAYNDPDTSNNFFSVAPLKSSDSSFNFHGGNVTGNTYNRTYTLSNGTTTKYTVADIVVRTDYGGGDIVKTYSSNYTADGAAFQLETYNETSDQFEGIYTKSATAYSDGFIQVPNVPEFNLSSKTVYDTREVVERLNELEQQEQTAQANFDPSFVDSMYTALDNGEISPAELRGAEGMVRYLSGNASVSEERYKIATHAVLDLERSDLNMTMTVQYDGATGYEVNSTTRERNYTDYVNQTYAGLVFSGETPTDGFETGQTYDTSALNGSQLIVTENDTVHFYDGNMTIEKMQDADGNEVNSTDWRPGPNYDTYSSDEYVKLLDTIAKQQQQIAEQKEEEEEDGGIGIPWFDGGDVGGLLGVGIIALVVLAVVGIVTDVTPGLGN